MRGSGTGLLFAIALVLSATACSDGEAAISGATVIRIGHFPNITHAPALVAHDMSRQGEGWFESRTGTKVEWFVYATHCARPNPKLRRVLERRGFVVREVAGRGPCYYQAVESK